MFLRTTPNLWLKQYIMYIKINNPDGVHEPVKRKIKHVTLDQIPFFN